MAVTSRTAPEDGVRGERDYRVAFVSDATSGTDERGLDELDDIGVWVADTASVVEWVTE